MKLGMFAINIGALAQPEALVEAARHAEECGIESLWTGEHVVLPDPQQPPSPLPPDTPILDPAIALALAAGVTSRIKLGTGIIILPQRNPVVLAKELASLDVICGGRFLFGIGIGYLESEFRAIGASFDDKGRRAEEYLAAMRSLWCDHEPAYDGKYVRFSGVQQKPRPLQNPLPVIYGGHSRAAYRRALASAQGWYGFSLDAEQSASCLSEIASIRDRVDRPAELGPLEITITPPVGVVPDADLLDRYGEIGVDRVVVMPLAAGAADYCAAIDQLVSNASR